jgi:hypothetical protein
MMSICKPMTGGIGILPKRGYVRSLRSGVIPNVSLPTRNSDLVVCRIANHNSSAWRTSRLSSRGFGAAHDGQVGDECLRGGMFIPEQMPRKSSLHHMFPSK